MKISEFCKSYNIRHQTVYTKIRRHRKQLDGHIVKDGCMELDDFAVELLKPAVSKTELSEEIESLKSELSNKNKKIEELRIELSDKKSEIENLHSEVYDRDLKISDLRKELNSKNDKISEMENLIAELKNKNSELEAKLSGSVIQKIFGKK